MLIIRVLFLLWVSVLMVACGGGGGGSSAEVAASSNAEVAVDSTGGEQVTEPEILPVEEEVGTVEPESEPEPDVEPRSYSLTLSWSVPAERVSGEPLEMSEIAAYEIYYFLEGDEGVIINVEGGYSNEYIVELNQQGNYTFVVSTIDTDGNYSDVSESVTVLI